MNTTARDILSGIHVGTDAPTSIISFQDPYGAENAIRLGDRIATIGTDDELDDNGQHVFTWAGYELDHTTGENIWDITLDTQAGYADDARAAITAWLQR